jgi:hypothetical protein
MRSLLVSALVALSCVAITPYAATGQRPAQVAPNAPPDNPVSAVLKCQLAAMYRAVAPYVAQARATYPAARDRFQAGLPPRHTFFVTTRLRDAQGREEQVFVAVDSVRGQTVSGRIWSQIGVVSGFRLGQPYTFADTELVDWMVARPDGSEEGNVVGKFLDTYTPPAECGNA